MPQTTDIPGAIAAPYQYIVNNYGDGISFGLHAARPAAPNEKTVYAETDSGTLFQYQSGAWNQLAFLNTPLGVDAFVIASTAPTALKEYATKLRSLGRNVWLCDGIADETEFNEAIDAIRATSYNTGVVGVSSGQFHISVTGSIIIKEGVSLQGSGFVSTWITNDAGGAVPILKWVDNTHSYSWVHIRDMAFNGKNTAGAFVDLAQTEGSTHLRLDRVYIMNTGSDQPCLDVSGNEDCTLFQTACAFTVTNPTAYALKAYIPMGSINEIEGNITSMDLQVQCGVFTNTALGTMTGNTIAGIRLTNCPTPYGSTILLNGVYWNSIAAPAIKLEQETGGSTRPILITIKNGWISMDNPACLIHDNAAHVYPVTVTLENTIIDNPNVAPVAFPMFNDFTNKTIYGANRYYNSNAFCMTEPTTALGYDRTYKELTVAHLTGNYTLTMPVMDANASIAVLLNDIVTNGFDIGGNCIVGDLYGASGAYRQSDADSDATHIQDDDAAFDNAVLGNTVGVWVKWASDAAGTLNTGEGYATHTDADTLALYKSSGADFAASYYYWIRKSYYVVPRSGYYRVSGMACISGCEDGKNYYVKVATNGNYGSGIGTLSNSQASFAASTLRTNGTCIGHLTAGDKLMLIASNVNATAATCYPNLTGFPYLEIELVKAD